MSCLLIQCRGPLQSWGTKEQGVLRGGGECPSRSGILGMLSSAAGLSRDADTSQWAPLRMGVRFDAPGKRITDFQTSWALGADNPSISYQGYLSDAAFLVVLEGPDALIDEARTALRHPRRTLYLGRKSCPPSAPVLLGVTADDLNSALSGHPWLMTYGLPTSSARWRELSRKLRRTEILTLETRTEASEVEPGAKLVKDVPLSWVSDARSYGYRSVLEGEVAVDNPLYQPPIVDPIDHDPMSGLDGDKAPEPEPEHDPLFGLI